MLLPTPPPHVDTIMLRKGREWRSDMSSVEVSNWLNHLVAHDPIATARHVFTALGIDVAARIERNELSPKARLVNQYRYINKGLSMELLVALSLRHLDKPEHVQSMCCVSDVSGHPNNFAPSGRPDLVSYYCPPAEERNFYILSEVSARREMSKGEYSEQLEQALSHAEDIIDQDEKAIVYALVINGAYSDMSTEKQRSLFPQYLAFKKEHGLTINSTIRVIPLNILDFIFLMRRVHAHYSTTEEHLESWVLESALSQTHDLLHQEHTPAQAKWIMQSLIDRLTEIPNEQLEFNERNDLEDDDH